MKKLFAVALILCLLIPAAVAEAPVDVKNLSDDELKALYKDVKAELMERELWDGTTLPAGIYIAGKGLPEGTYELTALSRGQVRVFKDYDSFTENRLGQWVQLQPGDKYTLALYGETCYFIMFNSTVHTFLDLDW